MNSYDGSPSLAPEAREKVLQTFRHTLQLARDARNEEALLGCDFILKMDTRFAPARLLLESLRGVPSGTRVDLAPFGPYLGETPAQAAPPVTAPAPGPVFPPRPAPVAPMVPPGPVPAAPAHSGSLDDLVFDDFAAADPFRAAAPAAPGPAPAAPAPPPSFAEPEPHQTDEPPEAQSGGFDFVQDPFGAVTEPPLAAAPAPPPEEPPPSTSRVGPAPTAATSTDPRIAQFLKQGDDALARGNPQEAIDLWSRVFLIDLSNDEASRRIDAARDQLADASRKVDLLLSEGVQLYEAGDLPGARSKFLDVLSLSEHDATARSYLNQIEAALSAPSASPSAATDSDFMRHELEAPHPPSFADGTEPSLESALSSPDGSGSERVAVASESSAPEARGPRRGGLDLRVVLAVGFALLLVIGGGAWWLFRGRRPRTVPEAKGTAASAAAPDASKAKASPDDPFVKAQQIFEQGKVDAAIQTLLAIPDSDPRHNEALTKIDQYRNAAAPAPAVPAPGPANIEELRAQGFAAMRANRYIDVVKALDPVVKARPDDAEAGQALKKAREQVDALRSAAKSYAEGDYDGAIKLLWELRKVDPKNQDVEEYLLNSYFNSGIQALQSGNMARASAAFLEATRIRPTDAEAQRLHKFTKRYAKGTNDLLSRVFVRHLTIRQ